MKIQEINWLDPDVKHYTDERLLYPDIITPDYGVGIKFMEKSRKTNEPIEYTSVANEDNLITLEITSFTGISIGAVHYYAKISTYDLSFTCFEDGKLEKHNICGAFKKPKEIEGINIKVRRRLTAKDIKNGTRYDKKRWEGYRLGNLVNAFDTEEEALQYAISLIKARFAGDWFIRVDGIYDYKTDADGDEYCEDRYKRIPLADIDKILETL